MHKNFAKLATKLITRNGRKALLVLPAEDSLSDDKPWRDSTNEIAPDPIEITIVQTQFTAMELDGVTIELGDKKFLADASVPINTGMKIVDEGPSRAGQQPKPVTYSIVAVDLVQPGETSIMYKVHVR